METRKSRGKEGERRGGNRRTAKRRKGKRKRKKRRPETELEQYKERATVCMLAWSGLSAGDSGRWACLLFLSSVVCSFCLLCAVSGPTGVCPVDGRSAAFFCWVALAHFEISAPPVLSGALNRQVLSEHRQGPSRHVALHQRDDAVAVIRIRICHGI